MDAVRFYASQVCWWPIDLASVQECQRIRLFFSAGGQHKTDILLSANVLVMKNEADGTHKLEKLTVSLPS